MWGSFLRLDSFGPPGELLPDSVFLTILCGCRVWRDCSNPPHGNVAFLVHTNAAPGVQKHFKHCLLAEGVAVLPGGVLPGAPFWCRLVVGGLSFLFGVAAVLLAVLLCGLSGSRLPRSMEVPSGLAHASGSVYLGQPRSLLQGIVELDSLVCAVASL